MPTAQTAPAAATVGLVSFLSTLDLSNCRQLPLAQLHAQALSSYNQQDLLRKYQQQQGSDLTDAAQAVCRALVEAVEQAGLFSSNEEAEDISTSELKYLLAPFYLAELLASSTAGGPSLRQKLVAEAISSYTAFLQRCAQYGLMGELVKKLYGQEEQGGQLDAHSKRTAKIERFKADKALKAQLSSLEQKRSQSQAAQEEDATESGPVGGARGWDEEDERLFWLTQLQAACNSSLGVRGMLQEEAKLLQHAPQQQQQAQGQQQSDVRRELEQQQQQEVVDQLRKIAVDLSTSGSKRQQFRSEVFRPGYTLPTRTLEEQAQLEMADVQRREQAEHDTRAAEEARRDALGEEGRDEEDALKQRAWDDWKDSNPRGWGNSKLRPCG